MERVFQNSGLRVIDTELGRILANNNLELAENLLKILMEELPATKKTLLATYQQQDYEALRKEVHKLHGGCCYCGVPRLKVAAADLEAALKSSDTKAADRDNFFEILIFELDQVLNSDEVVWSSY